MKRPKSKEEIIYKKAEDLLKRHFGRCARCKKAIFDVDFCGPGRNLHEAEYRAGKTLLRSEQAVTQATKKLRKRP